MNHRIEKISTNTFFSSIAYFAVAAILGLFLRSAFVFDLPECFNYRFVQHAHSHVALLGWLFAAYFIMVIKIFDLNWKSYSLLFWGLQLTVLGMLVTFSIVGYASISVFFSTAHIILVYLFVFKTWSNITQKKHGLLPYLFLRASLFFLVLSTLGTWAIGPVTAAGLKGSAIYYAAIQFYLHFLFNGWFIFAVIAIFFMHLKSFQIELQLSTGIRLYWFLLAGTILTYALAISWSNPLFIVFIINSIGVVIQMIALVIFLKLIFALRISIKSTLSIYAYKVLMISFVALTLKILVQTIVIIPALAEISYTIRNFVIGFIHLLMLGGLSLFAFGMISEIIGRSLDKIGTIVFVVGIISTELLLFLQGIMQWQGFGFMNFYYEMILAASCLIVVGILIILYTLWFKNNPKLSATKTN